MGLDEFFAGRLEACLIFEALRAVVETLGPSELVVSKSQVVFQRGKPFAWAWTPDRYLRRPTAPLVLTFVFFARDPSPRWKQVVEPMPGHFTHHLELWSVEEIDAEVRGWLNQVYELAGE